SPSGGTKKPAPLINRAAEHVDNLPRRSFLVWEMHVSKQPFRLALKAGSEEIWALPIIIIIGSCTPFANINPFVLLPCAETSSTLHVTNHVLYRGYERVKLGGLRKFSLLRTFSCGEFPLTFERYQE
ncbi:hypothetical protein TNCT_160631, partial [Trichonephila clavata]